MTEKSRAEHIASLMRMSFPKALQLVREVSQRSAKHARQHEWDQMRSDVYLIDPSFDPEYARVASTAREVELHDCRNCSMGFFVGYDAKGRLASLSRKYCPACLRQYGYAPCEECGQVVLGPDVRDGVLCAGCK